MAFASTRRRQLQEQADRAAKERYWARMTNPSKVAADLRAAGLTSPMYEGAAGMFGGQMFDPNQMVPAHASALRASALRQGGDLTEADALRRYEEAGGKPGEFPGVIPTATQVTGGGTAPGPEPLSATWADTILERRAGGNNLFLHGCRMFNTIGSAVFRTIGEATCPITP